MHSQAGTIAAGMLGLMLTGSGRRMQQDPRKEAYYSHPHEKESGVTAYD